MYGVRQTAGPPAEPFAFRATAATVGAALGAGLVVWLLAIAALSARGAAAALDQAATIVYPVVAALAYGAMAAVLVRRLPRLAGTSLRALGLRSPTRADGAVIALGTLAVIGLRLLTFAYLAAVGQGGHVQTGLGGFHPTTVAAAALVIVVGATLAPFSEELLFLGTLYRAIAERLPAGRAALASGLIFAAARCDLVLAPFFVAYGTLLAALYRRTGNLVVPIVVRAIFDGASYALLVWLAWQRP